MLRHIVKGKVGKGVAGALVLVALGLAVWQLLGTNASDAVASSRSRTFICTETGKPFQQDLKVGMTIPVTSPYTGRATGVEAELCFWTHDGGAKSEPTPVLLNQHTGKPGPTFCPDCGRLVVGLNPPPRGDVKPPPTREQYAASQRNKKSDRSRDRDGDGAADDADAEGADDPVTAQHRTPGS